MFVKNLINRVEVLLLLLFIIIAIVFTFSSQKNYETNLKRVRIVGTAETTIWHESEYVGSLIQGYGSDYKIEWYMPFYGAYVDIDSPVSISKIKVTYGQNLEEQLQIGYQKADQVESTVHLSDKRGDGYMLNSNFEILPEGWKTSDTFLVHMAFSGTKKDFVLPVSSILKDQETGKSYVYTIIKEAKIWGTEYSLKKVLVEIIESNGKEVAVKVNPGEPIIQNATEDLYPGMLVKIENGFE